MKKILIIIIILLIISAVYLGNQITATNDLPQSYFTVSKGETVAEISARLKNEQLIGSQFAFKLLAKLKKADSKIVAGEHIIKADSSISEVIDSLISQATINQEDRITLIEGWSNKNIAEYLSGKKISTVADFNSAVEVSQWRDNYSFLSGLKAKTLEGFIFPDTYRIFKNATAKDIVSKALDNFDLKLTGQMRADIKSQGKTIFEILTMASIVEKEARTSQEMRQVADIFWKRIDKGIGLQSDATVNFVSGRKDTRPSATELAIDSPYNTYKYRGLPPGPICNPGLEAIKAAIYPAKNSYYYFLYGKDGKIYYGRTYDEHLINVRKYLD